MSSVTFMFLLVWMVVSASGVKLGMAWDGTVYIRADGSVDPPDAPISSLDNVTYTLTGNITSSGTGVIVERDDIVVDGAGYSIERTVGNASEPQGIYLYNRVNVTVTNTRIAGYSYTLGINLRNSSSNNISGNTIADNWYGISLTSSWNNSISGNNMKENGRAICLDYASLYNSIDANTITNGRGGIMFLSSMYNRISGNNITANNGEGIHLEHSSNNSITRNNIADNYGGFSGIFLYASSNNSIYHNSFINNTFQAYSPQSTNIWDDGYPSGGNYWSNYNDTDLYHGPFQNESGSDGIGDSPYAMDANNTDHFPLMIPYIIPEFLQLLILPLFIIATLFAALVYKEICARPFGESR